MNRNTIKIVRIKNGDTLICGLSVGTDSLHTLEFPMQISAVPILNKKGVQGVNIYLQDWLEYSKDTLFQIPQDVVMLVANPDDDMIEEYFDALERSELFRIQQDFENISKNYDTKNKLDNKQNLGYNKKSAEPYEEEEYDTDEDETEDEDDMEIN